MGFRFPVEPGQVLIFARSVGDLDPVYEEQLSGIGEGEPLVVPPTFVQSAEHLDPGSRTRPRLRSEDPGRGGSPDKVHAEQHFEYFQPLRAGDRLAVVTFPGSSWVKRGSSRPLEFTETITEYRNQHGELTVRARKVSVRVGRRGQ